MIIAVWGSPGSGKTTLSMQLASEMSKRKLETIVVSTDKRVPTGEILTKNQIEKSINNILEYKKLEEEQILNELRTTDNKYVNVLSFKWKDNIKNTGKYENEIIVELMDKLQNMCDVIIVDCSNNLVTDDIGKIAIKMADRIIKVSIPNITSVAYYASELDLIDSSFIDDVCIYNKVHSYDPVREIENSLGIGKLYFPYSNEAYRRLIDGALFNSVKKDKAFAKELKKLTDLALEVKK